MWRRGASDREIRPGKRRCARGGAGEETIIEPTSSTFAPFRNPVYRRLWIASQTSNLGGLIQAVGAGWMMTSLSGQSDMVALVQASNTLPIMCFSLIAGALADNYDRRRILLSAQLFMVAVSALLAMAAWADLLTPWGLLAFTFLIGCGMALYNPSWQASMGDIVTRADLPAAVSLNSMGFNLMRSVGPALGGILVALAGAAAAFTVNAVSYLPIIWALLRWKPEARPNHLPREALPQALTAGLRYMSMSPNLMRVMLRAMVFGFGASAVVALLPIVARDLLAGSALTYGMLLGFFGLGAIGGVAVNSRVRARFNNEVVVFLAFLGFALGVAGLGLSRHILLSAPALLMCGACWVLALSLFNVTVQLSTPRWVVGRALSFYQTAVFGGMAAGAWCWGLLADAHGATVALMVAAVLLGLGAAIGHWLALPEYGSLDLDPLGSFTAPELRIDLRARSGPIMIMVDWSIAQKDVPAFLQLMQARRRVRIRDGARQWALLRDLENPDIWTETYHVATWVDYLRHNERRTKADSEVYEQLLKLHQGPGKPHVHRMIERQTVPRTDDMPLKPVSPTEMQH